MAKLPRASACQDTYIIVRIFNKKYSTAVNTFVLTVFLF